MSEIYLIRHGQASFGAENYDKLSPTGVRQSRITAKHFAKLELVFDAIYSGRMERQKETAKELIEFYGDCRLSVPEPILSRAFDEYDSSGVWESQLELMLKEDPSLAQELGVVQQDKKAFQKVFAKVMYRWVSGEYDQPGIESWAEYSQRVRQGYQDIISQQGAKKRLAVFSSGGPICVGVQIALGLSDHKAIEVNWQIMNASVTRFLYNQQGISLSVFNDITHLELEGDPQLITYR
jgi:broad specificity phosphatase PhoE